MTEPKPSAHPAVVRDDEERPPLTLTLDKLAYLIVKAREFDAKVASGDGESASNPADDSEVSVLEDTGEDGTYEELAAALDGLNDDEKIEVLALVWLGRGDFAPDDWTAALEQAGEVHDRRETAYLLGIPQLGDLLEDGLAMLGYPTGELGFGRL